MLKSKLKRKLAKTGWTPSKKKDRLLKQEEELDNNDDNSDQEEDESEDDNSNSNYYTDQSKNKKNMKLNQFELKQKVKARDYFPIEDVEDDEDGDSESDAEDSNSEIDERAKEVADHQLQDQDDDDEEDEEEDGSDTEEQERLLNYEDEDSQRTEIRKELANLTFEELEALKTKMGVKMYNEALFGTKSKSKMKSSKRIPIFKRETKNRPRELSSRIRVDKVRKIVHVPSKKSRDPRFENLCGEMNENIWKTNYSFLTDLGKEEESTLRERVKSDEVDDEEKARIKEYLQKLTNKAKSDAQKQKLEEKRRKEKEENVKRLNEGKRPYYMKKSTRKYLDLAEKYDELKSSGRLESYLKKKRKKNAIRDKKSVKLQSKG